MERFFMGLLCSICAFVCLFVACIAVRSATADGKVDYCYVTNDSGFRLTLFGHRPWRSDSYIGVYNNQDAALDFAAKLKCPVK